MDIKILKKEEKIEMYFHLKQVFCDVSNSSEWSLVYTSSLRAILKSFCTSVLLSPQGGSM